MCDPVTLTIAATVAATAVTAGGQLYAGAAAKQQGQYQQKVDQQNAHLADQQAQDAQQRGQLAAQQYQRKISQLQGRQQAAMAANGIDTGFGSALSVQEDTAQIGAEDVGTIYRNTANESKGYEISAANAINQGVADKAKGDNAFVGSLFEAGGTLLGGASQYGKLKAKMNTGGG